MANLEVEVMLEDHPHLFMVEIDNVLEAPKPGASLQCGICGFKGKVLRVGTPGRKERTPREDNSNQKSIFKE